MKESDWFGIPVAWCNETGVVTGYENGLFGPGDDITREQLATMLYRYAEYMGYDNYLLNKMKALFFPHCLVICHSFPLLLYYSRN